MVGVLLVCLVYCWIVGFRVDACVIMVAFLFWILLVWCLWCLGFCLFVVLHLTWCFGCSLRVGLMILFRFLLGC